MTITEKINTKQIESENYYFKKYICQDFKIFDYDGTNIIFFKLKNYLYYCPQNNLTNFFDIDFLKGYDGYIFFYEKTGLFGDRLEDFIKNKLIFRVELSKQIYHKNVRFLTMCQFIMTPFSENKLWYYDRYSGDIYTTNFETFETKRKFIGSGIKSINFITNYFFIVESNDELRKMYKWEDLTFPTNMTSIMEVINNEQYFPINYKGSVMAKICNYAIDFYDENLNIVHKIDNFLKLINYEPIQANCCEEHENMVNNECISFVKINDNCLFYYEIINLIDTKHRIVCNGLENKYCYDFTKEEIVEFKNNSLDFFVTDGIPFREDNKVKLLVSEYYPAGNWTTVYEPIEEK